MPVPAGVGQKHSDLAVLHPPRGTGVLTLHPGRAHPLLQETGVAQDQHCFRVAEMLDHVAAYVVADPVDVPVGDAQQPLQPIRGHRPRVLGQRPAVLTFPRPGPPAHPARQPTHQDPARSDHRRQQASASHDTPKCRCSTSCAAGQSGASRQRCVRPRALPTQRQPQRASGAGGAGTGGGGNANRHSVGDHACGDAIGHLAGATVEFVGARPRELDRDLAGAGRADEG